MKGRICNALVKYCITIIIIRDLGLFHTKVPMEFFQALEMSTVLVKSFPHLML